MTKTKRPQPEPIRRNHKGDNLLADGKPDHRELSAGHLPGAFFDYDGEPIYVGQTKESLHTRILRHLTIESATTRRALASPYASLLPG